MGAVAGWNKLLYAIRSNTLQQLLRRRPWGLRLDGDIWEAAANLIATKGTEDIRVIWIKGHATDADIAAGKSSEEQRRGHAIADTRADGKPRTEWLAQCMLSCGMRLVSVAHYAT